MSRQLDLSGREIIFEYISVGDSVRVAAVDVETGHEVVVMGPVDSPRSDLERIATRKLARKLEQILKQSESKKPRTIGRGFWA